MGKIIQFSKRKEENTDLKQEIWEVIEESYQAKDEEIRKKDEEEWRLYAEFYEHPEEVEDFYNAPYV